jgi:hypothetical protein
LAIVSTDPSIRRLLDSRVAFPIAHMHDAITLSPVAGLEGRAKTADLDLQPARNAELRSWVCGRFWIGNFDRGKTVHYLTA